MEKIRFTKGDLKRQRDALRQYQHYLPMLQLKKQQLQLEIAQQQALLQERAKAEQLKTQALEAWSGLLSEGVELRQWVEPKEVATSLKNIAGVDIPVFKQVSFLAAEYDLFSFPLWVDAGLEFLQQLVCLRQEIKVLEEGNQILRRELRITTQRVNLFEKIKIPEAEEAIRRIKIYLGDQMANAVGRSKIAKRKIEEVLLLGAAV